MANLPPRLQFRRSPRRLVCPLMPWSDDRRLCAVAAAFVMSALVVGAGCMEHPGVTSYTVQNVAGERPREVVTPNVAVSSGQAWFFKLMGKQETVQAAADPFARLMASVQFDAAGRRPGRHHPAGRSARRTDCGSPRWCRTAASHRWKSPSVRCRRTIRGDAYLKSNLDRWRGQVGLEPYAGDDWKQRAEASGGFAKPRRRRVGLCSCNSTAKIRAGEALTMLAAIVPRPANAP